MSDAPIYQRDIEVYGRFTVSQIQRLVLPMDASFKQALRAVATRLRQATEAVLEATAAAGMAAASGRPARGQAAALAAARDLLRRLVEHAASRPGGAALARDLLQGQTLTTVLRRPAKLVAAMTHALEVIAQHRRQLPDHAAWAAEIERARDALDPLVRSVRQRRLARRTPTPEVKAARDTWLTVYGAAKLLVSCVLRLHGKLPLMPQIFDDLADERPAPSLTPAPRPGAPASA